MRIELLNPDNGGAGYYVAELDEPATTDDHWGINWYPDIDKWCANTFGQQDLWGETPLTGWKRMRNKYFFVDECQLSYFMLRWL